MLYLILRILYIRLTQSMMSRLATFYRSDALNLFVYRNSDAPDGGDDAAGNRGDFCCVYFFGSAAESVPDRPARLDLSIMAGAETPSGMARTPQFFSARAGASRSAVLDYRDLLISGGDYWEDGAFDFVF